MSKIALIRLGWILAFLVGTILLATAVGLLMDFPLTFPVVKGLLLGAAIFLTLWLLWKGLQLFLWRVGRRLAFSYFLIGILPIPMATGLIVLNLYLLAGYFLGHLYRDAATALHHELRDVAVSRLADFERTTGPQPPARADDTVLGYYLDGRRVEGDPDLPEQWPAWLADQLGTTAGEAREAMAPFVARADGSATLAEAAGRGRRGVLAVFDGAVDTELMSRSDVWLMLLRAEDPRKEGLIRLQLGGKEFVLQPFAARPSAEERLQFFGIPPDGDRPNLWHRPMIWWGELAGPFRSLEDGSVVSEYVTASLNGSLATISRQLVSGSAEVNTAVWAGLIAITGVLLSIYALAIVMAFFMIFTLSRAVNRLSRATDAVQRGEFSVRIPVRRRDQIGELQRSFNEMAAGLDRSVLAIAQKEVLEKELQIARRLQQSLLPANMPTLERADFATLFEPSAAIGGDYFDILRIDSDRLAVVIADVSGHGLPTGLRMAMLKAALVILVEEGKPPDEIFRRLSAMVRSEEERRLFVTSTLAVVDLRIARLELTNAGHTPTYLLREGEVEEIALTGHPLGALGISYGYRALSLKDRDVLVWLSDGIVEATDEGGEPFGYERLQAALRGPATSAAEVRNRLMAAEEKHTGGRPGEDDKTLVAMRYCEPGSAGDSPAAR